MRCMVSSVLLGVLSRLRQPSIASAEGLAAFLQARASLIAQKCAIDYCRGKTGLASYALFTEETFLQALDVCRWEAFAAVLGDLVLLAEGHLRPHASAPQRPALAHALGALYRRMLEAQARPAHRPHGWADAFAAFDLRLEAAANGEPPKAMDVADHSAKRLFDTLPIHASYRELDEEVVYGAVRFRMIAVNQVLQRRIAPAPLLASLLA